LVELFAKPIIIIFQNAMSIASQNTYYGFTPASERRIRSGT
jgi:hypothetical protein